jgi:SNF2 family DNA or RNA helicase
MKPGNPELWKHQKEGVDRALGMHNFAFWFEQGTGKTRTVIETLNQRFLEHKTILRTIILTPPVVVPQFRQEWLNYTHLKPSKVITLNGSAKKRLKTFLENMSEPKIFITNYEALSMKDLFKAFQFWEPEAIVLDESQKVKSPTSQRSKLAFELANPFDQKLKAFKNKPYTYLLSGTPVLNSPMDLFQQYKILDCGETFGSNFFAFRARYFRDRNAQMPSQKHFPNWQPMSKERDGIDAVTEINHKLHETSVRVEKRDCLDLPPEVDVTVKCEMTTEQARLYKEMRQDLVAYLNDKACVATMALTKALRLMQIANGFLSVQGDDGPLEISLKDCPKKAALKELLEEICANPKNKVIVWSVWRKTYDDIREVCSSLGLGAVEVHGGISESKKVANIDAFRNNPDIRVFLGHPQSGGVGLNLVEAGYSIRYSRTFSLEQYLQSRARNHRGGSLEAGHQSITHYELVTDGTIEVQAQEKLANKIDMSNSLLSNLISQLGE